jgi:DNA-binding NtrC family response regulator
LSTHSSYVGVPASGVLLVSARIEDHDSLRSIFRGSPWELKGAWTVTDGRKTILRNPREIAVVICEHQLPDGDWKLLLGDMNKSALQPNLVVSSRLADELLWAEVLNLGAFDLLLGAPFEADEVLRVTESAWLARNVAMQTGAVRRRGPGTARNTAHDAVGIIAAGSGC